LENWRIGELETAVAAAVRYIDKAATQRHSGQNSQTQSGFSMVAVDVPNSMHTT